MRKAKVKTAVATARPLSSPVMPPPDEDPETMGRERGAGAAEAADGKAFGGAAGAEATDAAGAGLANVGAAGAAEGDGDGSRTVGAAVGFGGSAIRTVSFLG